MVIDMKAYKYIFLVLAFACAFSCKHGFTDDISVHINLDGANTYKAGEPVTFNFHGQEPELMTFFSGEDTHRYVYRNRTSVPNEDVTSAMLDFYVSTQYGKGDALEIYIGRNEVDLVGPGATDEQSESNAEIDRATIRKMFEDGMQGWSLIPRPESPMKTTNEKVYDSFNYDISEYLDGMVLAFHWHPSSFNYSSPQTFYYIQGVLNVGFTSALPISRRFRNFPCTTLFMNKEYTIPEVKHSPYEINPTVSINPLIQIQANSEYDFRFVGSSKAELSYDIDFWLITKKIVLNKVDRDTGVSVKSIMNPVGSFSHIYEKPGTYTATFVCINDTVEGRQEEVKSITISITD